MSHSPDDLVAEYCALPFPSDHQDDKDQGANWRKVMLLKELDVHANETVVSQLLLDILSAFEEYDLARVEAAIIVGVYITDSSSLNTQLQERLWQIFTDPDEDVLVRQHASQYIRSGYGGEQEEACIVHLLLDDEDDLNVRHGAFTYLHRTDNPDFVNRLLPTLRGHTEWGKYVKRLKHGQ